MVGAWLVFSWSRPVLSEEAPATPAEHPSLSQLQLAPIAVDYGITGNVGYTYRRDTIGGIKSGYQSLFTTVSPTVKAESFIWQPWFAQVTGGLGVNLYLNDYVYDTVGGSSTSKTSSIGLTGNGALKLVPASRFPFVAHFNKSDNRQSANYGIGTTTSTSETTTFGLDQRYRTVDGLTNYSASYNHNLWEGPFNSANRQNYLQLGMTTTRFEHQTLSINGNIAHNENPHTSESTQDNNLVVSHSYQPGNGLSVASVANIDKIDYHLTSGATQTDSRQLSSFASWQSDERPLTVTGSVRLAELRNNINTAWSNNSNANLGANYALTRNIRVYGTASVNDNNGVHTVYTSQTIIGNYNPNAIDLGSGLRYTRTGYASLTNQTDPDGGRRSAGLNLGHGLMHSSGFDGGSLTTSVNQTVTSNLDTRYPNASRLLHGGTLSWTRSANAEISQVRLDGTDSRAIGGTRDYFQIVNLQASRTEGLSRTSSLNGNLTMQTTHQGSDTISNTTTTNSSASLSYNNDRALNVARLNFVSELRFDGTGIVPVLTGPKDMESRSWNNTMRYSIGRLQLSLAGTIAEVKTVRQSQLLFTLYRTF